MGEDIGQGERKRGQGGGDKFIVEVEQEGEELMLLDNHFYCYY